MRSPRRPASASASKRRAFRSARRCAAPARSSASTRSTSRTRANVSPSWRARPRTKRSPSSRRTRSAGAPRLSARSSRSRAAPSSSRAASAASASSTCSRESSSRGSADARDGPGRRDPPPRARGRRRPRPGPDRDRAHRRRRALRRGARPPRVRLGGRRDRHRGRGVEARGGLPARPPDLPGLRRHRGPRAGLVAPPLPALRRRAHGLGRRRPRRPEGRVRGNGSGGRGTFMIEVDVKQKVLAANAAAAATLRARFEASGTLVVNLISSPGSGKRTLLARTALALKDSLRLGALEGDIATERDAERLRRMGIPARQILTGGSCHLDARLVDRALAAEGSALAGLDILFIENVGNLICPTSYDLGEDFKVVLLSVTEGEDKPFKYPAIFSKAAVTVVTKTDLLPYVPFDLAAAREQVRSLNPEGRLLEVSATTGAGMDAWLGLLTEKLAGKRVKTPAGVASV